MAIPHVLRMVEAQSRAGLRIRDLAWGLTELQANQCSLKTCHYMVKFELSSLEEHRILIGYKDGDLSLVRGANHVDDVSKETANMFAVNRSKNNNGVPIATTVHWAVDLSCFIIQQSVIFPNKKRLVRVFTASKPPISILIDGTGRHFTPSQVVEERAKSKMLFI